MNIGTNTMQIASVDTSAGRAISWAPLRMASSTCCPCSRCMLMFSMVTVASSTRMPTASARPPRVMMLMVSPSADRQRNRYRDDQGALPAAEKQQNHQRGQCGGDHRFAYHSLDRGGHEQRLIPDQIDVESGRQLLPERGQPLLDVLDDIEGRGSAGLQHAQQHAAAPVAAHDVGLRRVTI